MNWKLCVLAVAVVVSLLSVTVGCEKPKSSEGPAPNATS